MSEPRKDATEPHELGEQKGEGGECDIPAGRLEGDPGTPVDAAMEQAEQKPVAAPGAGAEPAADAPGQSAQGVPQRPQRQHGDQDLRKGRGTGPGMH